MVCNPAFLAVSGGLCRKKLHFGVGWSPGSGHRNSHTEVSIVEHMLSNLQQLVTCRSNMAKQKKENPLFRSLGSESWEGKIDISNQRREVPPQWNQWRIKWMKAFIKSATGQTIHWRGRGCSMNSHTLDPKIKIFRAHPLPKTQRQKLSPPLRTDIPHNAFSPSHAPPQITPSPSLSRGHNLSGLDNANTERRGFGTQGTWTQALTAREASKSHRNTRSAFFES